MPEPTRPAVRRLAFVAILLALAVQPVSSPPVAAIEPIDAPPAAPFTPLSQSVRPTPAATPVAEETDPDLEHELTEALRRARAQSGAPGLSIAVIAPDGTRWAGAIGRDRGGSPVSASEAMSVGSITKTFTAAIVMQLAEEGKIELDAPVSRYLTNVRLVRNGATVRDLLGHTSGIGDLYRPTVGRLRSAPDKSLSSNAVLGAVAPSSPKHRGDFSYSNTNYFLLGHVVEVVTGRTFTEELEARITDPMELDATRLLTRDDTLLPAAWSTAFWTSGAMASTPTDLATWGRALYGGDHLSGASMAEMLDFGGDDDYGLGTQHLPFQEWRAPGHSGLLYRNTSLLIHLPARDITIAAIATAPHADLESVLTKRHGGPSIIQLIEKLG